MTRLPHACRRAAPILLCLLVLAGCALSASAQTKPSRSADKAKQGKPGEEITPLDDLVDSVFKHGKSVPMMQALAEYWRLPWETDSTAMQIGSANPNGDAHVISARKRKGSNTIDVIMIVKRGQKEFYFLTSPKGAVLKTAYRPSQTDPPRDMLGSDKKRYFYEVEFWRRFMVNHFEEGGKKPETKPETKDATKLDKDPTTKPDKKVEAKPEKKPEAKPEKKVLPKPETKSEK